MMIFFTIMDKTAKHCIELCGFPIYWYFLAFHQIYWGSHIFSILLQSDPFHSKYWPVTLEYFVASMTYLPLPTNSPISIQFCRIYLIALDVFVLHFLCIAITKSAYPLLVIWNTVFIHQAAWFDDLIWPYFFQMQNVSEFVSSFSHFL